MKNKSAQTVVEYAFLILTVVSAVILMTTYGKRAVAGYFQRSANQISQTHFAPEKDSWDLHIFGDSARITTTNMDKVYDEETDSTGWQVYTKDEILHDSTSKSGTE